MQKPSHCDQRDTTACRDREADEIQVHCLINSTDVSHQLQNKNGSIFINLFPNNENRFQN